MHDVGVVHQVSVQRIIYYCSCLSTYARMYVCMHACVYAYMYVRMYVCMYVVCRYVRTCVCVYVCVHVYVHVCECVCRYICVCTHLYPIYVCMRTLITFMFDPNFHLHNYMQYAS